VSMCGLSDLDTLEADVEARRQFVGKIARKGQAPLASQEWRSSTELSAFGLRRPNQGLLLNAAASYLSNTEIAFNINFRFVLVDFDLATLQRITG
jgi:hypothetical protein